MNPTRNLRACLLVSATLTAPFAHGQSGSWNVDADGTWTDSANWLDGIIADGTNNSAFLTQNLTAARTITLGADRTIGNITFTDSVTSSHELTISGANILTLDVTTGAPAVNITQNTRILTIASEVSGNDGLFKTGPGTLTLTGANTFTGTLTVNGGTLNLGGGTATGSLASTPLVLNGATLNFSRTGTNTQGFTSTSIGLGASTLTATATNTVALGAVSNSAGGTLNLPPATAGIYQTSTANTNGMLPGWLTFNGQNFAFNDGTGISGAVTYYTTTTGGDTASNYANQNIDVSSSPLIDTGINANSIRFNGAAARTLDLIDNNILQSGAILVTNNVGANLSRIIGGTLAGSPGGALYLHQYNTNASGSLTIDSEITDNGGATALVKAGTGNANITNANTYTGKTYVNAGTLSFTLIDSLGVPATTTNKVIEIGNNATLNYTGLSPFTSDRGLNLTGTGSNCTFSNNGSTLTFTGDVTGSTVDPGSLFVRGTGNVTLDGLLSFSGGLAKSDDNILTLTNPNNSFGGTVTCARGVVSIDSISDSGVNSALGSGSQIRFGATGNANTGTLRFTGPTGGSSNRALVVQSNSANTNGGRIENTVAGQTLTLSGNVTTAWGGTGTRAPRLTLQGDGDGVMSGSISGLNLGIIKAGSGTWALTNSTNSHNGPTTIQAGTISVGADAPSGAAGALGNATSEVVLGVAGGNDHAALVIGGAFNVGRAIRIPTSNTSDAGTRLLTLGGSTAANSTFSGNIFLGSTNNAGRGVTLTAVSGGQVTFSGIIQNPTGQDTAESAAAAAMAAVTKSGDGTVVLSGANTYTGTTTVNSGTLALGANDVIPNASNVILGAATLDAATFTDTAGTLDVSAAAGLNLGAGATLAFANSSSVDWAGGSLNITGSFVSGSSIRFGNELNQPGLTPAQLAAITVNGGGIWTLDPNGYLVSSSISGFASWQSANGTSGGIDDDHDSDGVANGIEFFLGGTAITTGFNLLPGVTPSGGNPSITWTKAATYPGGYNAGFVVQTSDALSGWTNATTSLTPGVPGTVHIDGNNVTYTFPAGTRKFARLKVTGP